MEAFGYVVNGDIVPIFPSWTCPGQPKAPGHPAIPHDAIEGTVEARATYVLHEGPHKNMCFCQHCARGLERREWSTYKLMNDNGELEEGSLKKRYEDLEQGREDQRQIWNNVGKINGSEIVLLDKMIMSRTKERAINGKELISMESIPPISYQER